MLDVGRRGARLMLEDGRAHVQVAHRPGADWQVQAGAFLIHVHGTAFFVEWNAAQSRLDLQMESGVVSVDGPRSSDTVMLRGGQSLSVRLDGSRMVAITTADTRRARVGRLPDRRSCPCPLRSKRRRRPSRWRPSTRPDRRRAPPRHGARWSERLADGEAAGIVAEAQRRGVASVLAGASSEDLAALADAARFRNQDHLARRVLLAQRRRFPGTLRAEEASFLLGRLADGPGGRASDALAWYDRYLREAPSGAYAAEAMGRMMLVLERQQRTDEARHRRGGVPAPVPAGRVRPSRASRGFVGPVNDRGAPGRQRERHWGEGSGFAAAIAFAAFALAPAAARAVAPPVAAGGRVTVLQSSAASPRARRCLTRLREELAAGGFEVTVSEFGAGGEALWMVDPPSHRDGSIATITLVGNPDEGDAELWIVDGVPWGRVVVRRLLVPAGAGTHDDEVLAVRTLGVPSRERARARREAALASPGTSASAGPSAPSAPP